MTYARLVRRGFAVLVAGLVWFEVQSPAKAGSSLTYTAIEIAPQLDPDWRLQPNAISDCGFVVGTANNQATGVSYGFLWHTALAPEDFIFLPSPPGDGNSEAWGVNDYGSAVGAADVFISATVGYVRRAALWENYEWRDLGTLSPFLAHTSVAYGINNHRSIVGKSQAAGAESRAFVVWEPGTRMLDLGTPTYGFNGINSIAYAIDDSYAIVGTAQSPTAYHAFYWSPAYPLRIDLHPTGSGSTTSEARHLAGLHAVGTASTDRSSSAIRWSDGGVVRPLPYWGGRSQALAINASGFAVGSIAWGPPESHVGYWRSALWRDSTEWVDLSDLVVAAPSAFISDLATGINGRNQIVVRGSSDSGLVRAFLLQPDPLPAVPGQCQES